MSKIRVLIVDDSAVVRKLLSMALQSDPEIEIAGLAADGNIALAKLVQVNPDIVTLDIEMPNLDGLETLKALRKTHPRLPVIMFSTLTERGAAVTLEALALGASDYVTKPTNSSSLAQSMGTVRDELVPKMKALVRPKAWATSSAPALLRPAAPSGAAAPRRSLGGLFGGKIEVVAIGISTGGPNALNELIPALPENLGVPVVIVQHMPPMFTRLLAERLDTRSALTVREGEAGGKVVPGSVWVAPGGSHMVLERSGPEVLLRLNQEPAENSCRPAVDPLFRSVVGVYGRQVLAVVMTGMGQDGFRGCEKVREAGGQILAQDEASSVVWGMPGFVAKAGLADAVLPLKDLAAEIVRRVGARPAVASGSRPGLRG